MENEELIKQIKEEFPSNAIDILESLELLNVVINDTVEAVGLKINKSFSNKKYDKIPSYLELAKNIGLYQKKIEDTISKIDIDEFIVNEETDEETESKNIPNYSEYIVDSNLEHSLYENFTHKRPYGFKINNENIIKVKTWQEMLIKTCEYLLIIDENKFVSFENKKIMNGKKNKYFSINPDNMRKPKKVANKIYVEINLSSNGIRNLIMKLLKEYNINISQYRVYFRADYTSINE